MSMEEEKVWQERVVCVEVEVVGQNMLEIVKEENELIFLLGKDGEFSGNKKDDDKMDIFQ